MIDSFTGKYRFLSNFYPSIVVGPNSYVCETVEHAFQAWKTVDKETQRHIAGASTPRQAKKMGRACKCRGDWNQLRLAVMGCLIAQKFEAGTDLADRLLGTGDDELIEGNTWGDRFWGATPDIVPVGVHYVGENWLGRLLMLQRSELYFQL